METQSSLPGGLNIVGSTYLGDIAEDLGGSKASTLGQRAAERYLDRPHMERFDIRTRVLGASVVSAAILSGYLLLT